MYNNIVGSKYEQTKDLDIKEIAKLVRQDLKDAVKAGVIPNGKFGVRIDRFAGGQALNVTVQELDICMYNLTGDEINEKHASRRDVTPEAKAVLKEIEQIISAYNFDKSHVQTDYFHVRFYEHVGFDYDFLQREFDKAKGL